VRTDAWPEPFPIGGIGGAWIFPGASIIYTESRGSSPTERDVHALFDFFEWLAEHVPEARAPTIVHDWRSIKRVPREARSAFVWRRRKIERQPERVVVALSVNPVVRMTIQTVSMAAQLLARAVPLDVVGDPMPPLRERGATEPDATLHARLRLAWQRTRGA
jgi:hypothetical protein